MNDTQATSDTASKRKPRLRAFELCEEGSWYESVMAPNAKAALAIARQQVNDYFEGDSFSDSTKWIEIQVARNKQGRINEDTIESTTVTQHPPMPDCNKSEHSWETPYSLVGGDRNNPGVFGSGGGVISTEVCEHCGVYRVKDTWAQNPSNGEQGLTSIEYRRADEASLEWIATMDMDDDDSEDDERS